jgi:hypothetical protein
MASHRIRPREAVAAILAFQPIVAAPATTCLIRVPFSIRRLRKSLAAVFRTGIPDLHGSLGRVLGARFLTQSFLCRAARL